MENKCRKLKEVARGAAAHWNSGVKSQEI